MTAGVPSISGMVGRWMRLVRMARDLEVVLTAFGAKVVVMGLNTMLRVMEAMRMEARAAVAVVCMAGSHTALLIRFQHS